MRLVYNINENYYICVVNWYFKVEMKAKQNGWSKQTITYKILALNRSVDRV
jgi:hypothetical protein